MKKLACLILAMVPFYFKGIAQQQGTNVLQNAVNKLDQARKTIDYEALEKEFLSIGGQQKKNWLPYYYAAFCNAKIGFIRKDDGESIEPYSNRGEQQALMAKSLLDTLKQKKECAEVYTVLSMVYRTKVFISPMSYGRKYGPLSQQYRVKAQALDATNPRAMYVQAWELYNTPKLWGGDKAQAKQLATESLKKLKAAAVSGTEPHWGIPENTALLGNYK